jgi:hypothetical protein
MESMNFAHIPVDAVANKLRLNAVTVDDHDLEGDNLTVRAPKKANDYTKPVSNASGGASGSAPKIPRTEAPKNNPVNAVIEDLFDYNEFSEELPILFRNTGKLGDYYMMVWPVVGEESDSPTVSKAYDEKSTVSTLATGEPVMEDNHVEAPESGDRSIVAVDMLLLDPFTTRVFYDVENPKKKKFAIRSWEEGYGQNKTVRANLYYPDRIERWLHKGKPSKRKNAEQKWEHFTGDGKPWKLTNPFDEIPIFHFRTDRAYGLPDHYNAYGPQLAINKLVTSHLVTVDYQSFPQRYALLDPTADQSMLGADSDPFAPEDGINALPEDEDNESQLEADPGALWQLSGMKTVGQFQAANSDAYLKPFDRYVKALAQVTDTPFHYFDRTGERPPSGENIRQVNESLNSKAAARQTSYGSELRKSVTFALNMLGHDVERVNVIWEPLENVTSLVEWQAINEKQAAGVPMDVTLVEAGYRKDLVAEWTLEAEQAAQDEMAQQLEMDRQQLKLQHEIQPTPDILQSERSNQNSGGQQNGSSSSTTKPAKPAPSTSTSKPKPSATKK